VGLKTIKHIAKGRAVAQAVSRWLPTAAARVRSRVWSSGICGRQSGAGAGFLRVLRFPLPIFIPPTVPQSPSPIIWGWYNRPEVAAVQGTSNKKTYCNVHILRTDVNSTANTTRLKELTKHGASKYGTSGKCYQILWSEGDRRSYNSACRQSNFLDLNPTAQIRKSAFLRFSCHITRTVPAFSVAFSKHPIPTPLQVSSGPWQSTQKYPTKGTLLTVLYGYKAQYETLLLWNKPII
jgi:hypothetical protein